MIKNAESLWRIRYFFVTLQQFCGTSKKAAENDAFGGDMRK